MSECLSISMLTQRDVNHFGLSVTNGWTQREVSTLRP